MSDEKSGMSFFIRVIGVWNVPLNSLREYRLIERNGTYEKWITVEKYDSISFLEQWQTFNEKLHFWPSFYLFTWTYHEYGQINASKSKAFKTFTK